MSLNDSGVDAERRIAELLSRQQALDAARIAARAIRRDPRNTELHQLMARAAQQLGDFHTMRSAAAAAQSLHDCARHRLLLYESLLLGGDKAEALRSLRQEEQAALDDAPRLRALAELYAQAAAQPDALRCHRRACALAPQDRAALHDLGVSLLANGELDAAEAAFEQVLAQRPDDGETWYNLATVRRQSESSNHVEHLRALLDALAPQAREQIPLCFALAKELEDLGRDAESFACLQRGAAARRERLSYRVEGDIEAMACLREVFSIERLGAIDGAAAGPGPIFVTGLPRSGTTLVDRLLSAHSRVESLGEINDLALSLVNSLGRSDTKLALIRRAGEADFADIGQRYLRATRGYGREAKVLVDKLPLNFLYIGLIALALPGARIVHLRRNPMDNCYAMYKTLFRMGYPFSYDLEDLGRYYQAYDALMQHWGRALPGRVHWLSYEALVNDPEQQARELLAFCGLDWEAQCLRFHEQAGVAATASAAQVRQPIYRSSVGLWRRYEAQLEPLARRLREAGSVE